MVSDYYRVAPENGPRIVVIGGGAAGLMAAGAGCGQGVAGTELGSNPQWTGGEAAYSRLRPLSRYQGQTRGGVFVLHAA